MILISELVSFWPPVLAEEPCSTCSWMNSANFDLCIAAPAFNALVFHNSHSENAVFRYVDLKSSFQEKKKGHKKPLFFSFFLVSLPSSRSPCWSYTRREARGEDLKGHFKNISERNIKETTTFKRDPSCQTKSKVALHNDYLIAED